MNSKITFGIDWNNVNQPIIKIVQKISDDHRDEMVQAFLEKVPDGRLTLQFISENCPNNKFDEDAHKIFFIKPAPEKDYTRTVIHDNSIGLRAFLDSMKIQWVATDFTTIIMTDKNLFELGRACERYKTEHPRG